jgi:hypothetical protein
VDKSVLAIASIVMLAAGELPLDSPWVNWGLGGLGMFVIWWLVTKTIPEKDRSHTEALASQRTAHDGAVERISRAHTESVTTICETHRESSKQVTTALGDVKQAIDDGNKQQAELLRRAIWGKEPPKGPHNERPND